MALSFNQKSSSSASSARKPKPTYRRATGTNRPPRVSSAAPRPVRSDASPASFPPVPKVKPSSYTVPPARRKSGSITVPKATPGAVSKPAIKAKRPVTVKPAPRPVGSAASQQAGKGAGKRQLIPVSMSRAGRSSASGTAGKVAKPVAKPSGKHVKMRSAISNKPIAMPRLPRSGQAALGGAAKSGQAASGAQSTVAGKVASAAKKTAIVLPPRPQKGSKKPALKPLKQLGAARPFAGGKPKAATVGAPVAAATTPATPTKRRGKLSGAVAGALSKVPLPSVGRGPLLIGVGAVVLVLVAVLVVANSSLFAATDVTVNGSAHVSQQTAEQLLKIPDGTTLLNVNESQLADSLSENPWVSGVDIKREFPHKLVITPRERAVKAIVYITADDVAWGVGEDGTWIAPLSLSIATDADGKPVEPAEDGSLPEGAQQLSGTDAAHAVAKRDGALLLTDAPSDVSPQSGEPVDSDVVQAGLEYAKGFTSEFLAQIKDLSIPSVEAISANLNSGVEVSLGEPENITEKERVVTKLLQQEQGVTYVNVREPGAYTFRSAPSE